MSEKKNIVKKYSNGEVTIVWKPDLCIHSENCFKGLPEVFNPEQRPWINAEGASTEAIVEQVKKCPSGALSFIVNGEETEENANKEKTPVVEVMPNGPLLFHGVLTIKRTDGTEQRDAKVTAFCRCGASQNKPFCDGTHKKVGFEG